MNDMTWEQWVQEFRASGRGDLEQLGRTIHLICYVGGVQKTLALKDAYEAFCQANYRVVRKLDEFSTNFNGHRSRQVILDIAGNVGRVFTIAIMKRQMVLRCDDYQRNELERAISQTVFVSHARHSRKLIPPAMKGQRLFYCDHESEQSQEELVYRPNKRVRSLLIWSAAGDTNEDDVPYDIFSGPIDDPPADKEIATNRPRRPQSPERAGEPRGRRRKTTRPEIAHRLGVESKSELK